MLLKARSEFPHSVVKALHAIILTLRNFMLRNDDVDLLALRYTLVTLGDFQGDQLIFNKKFVGIILTHLHNDAGNFGQPMSNIAVRQ